MKQKYIKKIGMLCILIMSITIGVTYANWEAGNGLNWIAKPDNTTRFVGPNLVDNIFSYTDTFTGIKWEANPDENTRKWANCDNSQECQNYEEPIWNGASYEYPVGKTELDYPAFQYCTDKGAGWRLPTKREIVSLISYRYKNTADKYTALPSIKSDSYWTSTKYGNYDSYARRTGFQKGTMFGNEIFSEFSVICVHD